MDLFGIGSIVQGVAGLAGTAMTNAQNKKNQEDQQAFDLEMWQRQNEYNSPAAQMQRLKDAGLNPHDAARSVVGAGNATSAPTTRAVQSQDWGASFNRAFGFLQNYLGMKKTISEIAGVDSRTQLNQAQTRVSLADVARVDSLTRHYNALASGQETRNQYNDLLYLVRNSPENLDAYTRANARAIRVGKDKYWISPAESYAMARYNEELSQLQLQNMINTVTLQVAKATAHLKPREAMMRIENAIANLQMKATQLEGMKTRNEILIKNGMIADETYKRLQKENELIEKQLGWWTSDKLMKYGTDLIRGVAEGVGAYKTFMGTKTLPSVGSDNSAGGYGDTWSADAWFDY